MRTLGFGSSSASKKDGKKNGVTSPSVSMSSMEMSSDSPKTSGSGGGLILFNFERTTKAFEQIQDTFSKDHQPLCNTTEFVTAMREVVNLFDILGSAFTFVRRDIENKINIIDSFGQRDAENYTHLYNGVQFELDVEKARIQPGDPPSCARTLLRLMWALKFADLLLEGLKMAFDAKSSLTPSERSLKWAVARAYEEALAEHHSWTIRRAVKSACMLLPTKETFVTRLGLTSPQKRDDSLTQLAVVMSPLVQRMYGFYNDESILDLP